MKAKKVKGLDPAGTFAENARRIADVRLAELEKLAGAALESGESEPLHDMRIAAKRLRYVLEMSAPALGPAAQQGSKTAKRLQSLLGDIHDCDETLPRIAAHTRRLRERDAASLAAGAAEGDLDPATAKGAPNRHRYAGLETLAAYMMARRAVLLETVRREWASLEPRGFAADMRAELSSAPEPPAQPGAGTP